MAVAMAQLIQTARSELQTLTGLELGGTVSARKDAAGWHVQVEAVAKRSIPDSQDILAIYDVALDLEANVLDFSRIGMRKRSDVSAAIGGDS